MKRREMLKVTLAASGLAGLAGLNGCAELGPTHAAAPAPTPSAKASTDGTPAQFIPKTAADADPLTDELKKYPKCPYCGMDRKAFHHARHLVQYSDNLVDGTCSIHCLATSLSLNIDREPKAIYAADFGSAAELKPLVSVDKATYLIGSKLKGVMTATSKVAFASKDAAVAAQAQEGGELGDFDKALTVSFADMARDTLMIRKRRQERRKQMEGKPG